MTHTTSATTTPITTIPPRPSDSQSPTGWELRWIPAATTGAEPGVDRHAAPEASEPEQPLQLKRRNLRTFLGEAILNVLAVAGVICIALVIWAFVGGYSFIMFKTGSMAPTIPQGSLALVHRIPATEVRVGDIVTIDRVGRAPVTHRVIAAEDQGRGEVLITMQGDANDTPDIAPYRVSEVRKVVWHAPGLARQVVWMSEPRVLGTITVAMTGLILWAFWPRKN